MNKWRLRVLGCVLLSLSSSYCEVVCAQRLRREVTNLRAETLKSTEIAKTSVDIADSVNFLSPTPQGDAVAAGVQWLKNNQNPSGSWGGAWEFADTTDAVCALREVAPDCNETAEGAQWLAGADAANYEFLARQIIALAGLSEHEWGTSLLVDELVAARNESEWDDTLPNWPEGGWGLAAGYETDCMTTAIALMALKAGGLAGGMAVQDASLIAGEHVTYVFDVPADALKIRVNIDALSGGPIQVRLQEGSEPPFYGMSYFPISSAPAYIVYPDSGIGFTPGENYLRIDSPTAATTFSLTVSYETPDWDTRTLGEAMAYLDESQNMDGGWGLQRGVTTDLYTTVHTILTLQDYSHYGRVSELADGLAYLRSMQLIDGSFGYEGIGSVVETALAGLALMTDDEYPFETDTLDVISYLVSMQWPDGSWNGNPYDTAVAMLALWEFNQDPCAQAGDYPTMIDVDGDLVEEVSLDGSGSSDLDGTIESYVWTEDGLVIATGVSPTVEFTVGTHAVELTVTDDGGKSDTDQAIIKVTPAPETIYSANMDADPCWAAEGLWEWGQPTGQGGGYGDFDPISGYTGTNVYGYNLQGTYADNMPETYLTTSAIDCSGYNDVELSFYRWLNVQDSPYDNATVQITTTPEDAESWTTIYQNPNDSSIGWLHETSWSQHMYDISMMADGQPEVYIRWCMGPTDGLYAMAGWNIDDVVITGVQSPPSQPALPDLLPEDDSGVSDTDDITGVEAARIALYAADTRTTGMRVYRNDDLIGNALDHGEGYWEYQFSPGQLTQGDNLISAVAVGSGGYSLPSYPLLISYRPHTLAAEFDGDGIVDLPDLGALGSSWLEDDPSHDIAPPSGDLTINLKDFAVMAETWQHSELWYPVNE